MICDPCTQRENKEQKSIRSPPLHVYGSQIYPHSVVKVSTNDLYPHHSYTAIFTYTQKISRLEPFSIWVGFFKLKLSLFPKQALFQVPCFFQEKNVFPSRQSRWQVLRLPLGRWTQFLPGYDKDKKYPSTKKNEHSRHTVDGQNPANHQG